MKININAVNFDIDRKLVDFIKEKANKLEKYYDKIVDCDIYLKVENTSDKENKTVEIKLGVPGDDLIVKKHCKSFEEAVELCRESLERQVVKKKEKKKYNFFKKK